jgi:type IV pilus assembly protein PilV
MNMRTESSFTRGSHRQVGSSLLETLIAILVFSLGILSMLSMYAVSISAAGDAQYRSEATNYATELLQAIGGSVPRRTDGTVIATELAKFAVNASGGATCAWTGGAPAAPALLTNWWARIQQTGSASQPASGLPGASANGFVRVAISDVASFNRVAISICWDAPNGGGVHRHEVIGYVN